MLNGSISVENGIQVRGMREQQMWTIYENKNSTPSVSMNL